MILLVGIFGGMLLTVLLYGLCRRLGLSNFWAAVVAGALPAFAYLGYAAVAWPGLDVVTLHVIAYPTVAILLSQLYGAKADHGKTMHWAPKLMVMFFVGISVIFGGFVYIAGQGLPPGLARLLLPDTGGRNVHTGFAGVVEHHQGAAKGIASHLNMDHRLSQLGWQVDVAGLQTIRAGQAQDVVVRVIDPSGNGLEGMQVGVVLGRPGQDQDVELVLSGGAPGYHGRLPPLVEGAWVARLTLAKGAERVVLEHGVEVIR